VKNNTLRLDDDHKVYWKDNPIAFITPGKNYLNPKLELLIDDAIDIESKEKLKINLNKKLNSLITTELNDLFKLSESKFKNNYVRALCYQLFENNGVIKREAVDQTLKKISKEDRVSLRKAGVKIGRYNVFLPKMLKPDAVNLRVKLWKLYYPKDNKNVVPKFGLNFLKDEVESNKKFLLICGFENFNKFYIRVDILERLFLKIIENTKDRIFKVDSDMINLIGCSKENFYKLLKLMHYLPKKASDSKGEFFTYAPKHNKIKKIHKKYNKNNPFNKLSELRFR